MHCAASYSAAVGKPDLTMACSWPRSSSKMTARLTLDDCLTAGN